MEGEKLVFRGLIASPDGTQFYDTTREGKPEDAAAMGHDAGMELKVTDFVVWFGFLFAAVTVLRAADRCLARALWWCYCRLNFVANELCVARRVVGVDACATRVRRVKCC